MWIGMLLYNRKRKKTKSWEKKYQCQRKLTLVYYIRERELCLVPHFRHLRPLLVRWKIRHRIMME